MTLTTLSVLRTEALLLCIQHGRANVTFAEDKENDTPARFGEFETPHEKMEVSSGCKRWAHGVRFGRGRVHAVRTVACAGGRKRCAAESAD